MTEEADDIGREMEESLSRMMFMVKDDSFFNLTDEYQKGMEKIPENSAEITKKIDKSDSKDILQKDNGQTMKRILIFMLILTSIAISLVAVLSTKKKQRKETAFRKFQKIIKTQTSSTHIPLFIYVPGTSATVIPSVLSTCFGLTEASLNYDIKNTNFVTTTSLCNKSSKTKIGSKLKLFHLLKDPILRIPSSYIEMKDPSSIFYDSRLRELTFEQYIMNDTLFEKDVLTKRLLCIENDDSMALSKYNVNMAKGILKKNYINLFQENYDDSFVQFKKAFHEWGFLSSPIADECVKKTLELELKKSEDLYRKHGIEFHEYFNVLKNANKFDTELYAFAAIGGA